MTNSDSDTSTNSSENEVPGLISSSGEDSDEEIRIIRINNLHETMDHMRRMGLFNELEEKMASGAGHNGQRHRRKEETVLCAEDSDEYSPEEKTLPAMQERLNANYAATTKKKSSVKRKNSRQKPTKEKINGEKTKKKVRQKNLRDQQADIASGVKIVPSEPAVVTELAELRRQEREKEIEELKKEGKLNTECSAEDDEIGRCSALPAFLNCPQSSQTIMESQRRHEIFCSSRCKLLYHSACFTSLSKKWLALDGWQLKSEASCLTPDCDGTVVHAHVKEGKKVVHVFVEKQSKQVSRYEVQSAVNKGKQPKHEQKDSQKDGAENKFDKKKNVPDLSVSQKATTETLQVTEEFKNCSQGESEQISIHEGGSASSSQDTPVKSKPIAIDDMVPLEVYRKEEQQDMVIKDKKSKPKKTATKETKGKLKMKLSLDQFVRSERIEQHKVQVTPAINARPLALNGHWAVKGRELPVDYFPPLGDPSSIDSSNYPAPVQSNPLEEFIVHPECLVIEQPVHLLIENVDPMAAEIELVQVLTADGICFEKMQRFMREEMIVLSFRSFEDAFDASMSINEQRTLRGRTLRSKHLLSKIPGKEYFHQFQTQPGPSTWTSVVGHRYEPMSAFLPPPAMEALNDPLPGWTASLSSSQSEQRHVASATSSLNPNCPTFVPSSSQKINALEALIREREKGNKKPNFSALTANARESAAREEKETTKTESKQVLRGSGPIVRKNKNQMVNKVKEPVHGFEFGLILAANSQTVETYKSLREFALGQESLLEVSRIQPRNCALFLFNVETCDLHGCYRSTTGGVYEEGSQSMSVEFQTVENLPPLPRAGEMASPLFPHDFFSSLPWKLPALLSRPQVEALLDLFLQRPQSACPAIDDNQSNGRQRSAEASAEPAPFERDSSQPISTADPLTASEDHRPLPPPGAEGSTVPPNEMPPKTAETPPPSFEEQEADVLSKFGVFLHRQTAPVSSHVSGPPPGVSGAPAQRPACGRFGGSEAQTGDHALSGSGNRGCLFNGLTNHSTARANHALPRQRGCPAIDSQLAHEHRYNMGLSHGGQVGPSFPQSHCSAAAVHSPELPPPSGMASMAAAPNLPPPPAAMKPAPNVCGVCFVRKSSYVVMDCTHFGPCDECFMNGSATSCPVCGGPVSHLKHFKWA